MMNIKKYRLFFLILIIALVGCATPQSTLRYPAVRWLDDEDKTPIKKPGERHEYKYADYVEKHFFYQMERLVDLPLQVRALVSRLGGGGKQEALNVNNFDEVADSTWFTNRLGRFDMTPREIALGAGTGTGPETQGPWIVESAKTSGLTPGFVIEDAHGEKYVLKFDPREAPELASGAEVISTKFMHAFGYNVPDNVIIEFDPTIMRLAPDAYTTENTGKKRRLTDRDIDNSFAKLAQSSEGKYRALASRFLPGEPLGPFPFRGTRTRDVNDRIPHQHRRELRGYRVMSALLNNTDAREGNTLDMFIRHGQSGQKGHVQHNILDFGATLGSASVKPKIRSHMYDYHINPWRMLLSFMSLGFYEPYWIDAKSPRIDSVGFFESKVFRPERWKPTYANPLFQSSTDRDAFWATKILMKFTDEDIAAIVREARYSDPEATTYVTKTLIERRDKIGRHWYKELNPLDEFQLTANDGQASITFKDLARTAGFNDLSTGTYRFRFPHADEAKAREWILVRGAHIPLPSSVVRDIEPDEIHQMEIQTQRTLTDEWSPTIELYFKNKNGPILAGLKRSY